LPPVGGDQDQRSAAYTVIRQHIYTAPTPPGRLKPAIAASPLEKATLKALEKDPNKRYGRAMELAKSLAYRPGEPVRRPVAVMRARLAVLDGPNRGHVVPVESSRLVLGRMMLDPNNVQISRQHAALVQKGQEWWVQDTSMNGTWVNGQRVYGEVPLTGDKIIEIGGYRMQLQN
jgi:FHA domain